MQPGKGGTVRTLAIGLLAILVWAMPAAGATAAAVMPEATADRTAPAAAAADSAASAAAPTASSGAPATSSIAPTTTIGAPAAQAPAAAGPALIVADGNAAQKLRVARVEATVRILGDLAETKMTLVFANPEDRDREGELIFPLPAGASVCGYALDIQGKMIDGVVVDSQQGRTAYESITRLRKDPALLELVGENTFRTRVFPIPAKGTRAISVRYVTQLAGAGDGGARYTLPLNFPDKVDEFSLTIEAVGATLAPKVIKGGPADFAFTKGPHGFAAETRLRNATLREPLVVALPREDIKDVIVERAPDGKVYFSIRRTALPAGDAPGKAPAAPRRITILWDASGSRSRTNHTKELRALAAYLGRFEGKPVAVDLVVFRHEPEKTQQFTLAESRAADIVKAVEAVDYDGATNLAAVATAAGATPPDAYLLFTDGYFTTGKEEVASLGAPVYIFTMGRTWSMGALVIQNGGECFNLDAMSDADIREVIGRPLVRYARAEVTAGRISDLCPSRPQLLTPQTALVGRLDSDEATVTVKFRRTDTDQPPAAVAVSGRDAPQGTLLRYVWAAAKAADLAAALTPDNDEIAEIGKEYGVVTQVTSLIVLESLQQHIQFHIRPPDMLPDMQKEYDVVMASRAREAWQPAPQPPAAPPGPKTEAKDKDRQPRDPKSESIYNILTPWYFRLALWDDEPTYPPNFRYTPTGTKSVSPGGVGAAIGGGLYAVAEAAAGGPFGGAAGGEGGWHSGGGAAGGLFGTMGGAGGGGTYFGGRGVGPRFDIMQVTQAASAESPIPLANRAGMPSATPINPKPGGPAEDVDTAPPSVPGAAPSATAATTTATSATPAAQQSPTTSSTATAAADQPDDTHTFTPEEVARQWNPDPSYRKALADAPPEKMWAVYMAARQTRADSPTFYVEAAEAFFVRGDEARGRQVASNLWEIGKLAPMRSLAMRMVEQKRFDLAAWLFEQVAADEQDVGTYRDVAMALEAQGKHEEALAALKKATSGEWTGSDGLATVTSIVDLNLVLAKAGPDAAARLKIDRRLIHRMEGDLRVVITWDADDADIDLAVTEPSGERCYYDHAYTTIGGQLWYDVDYGHGPEEYVVRRALAGKYKIDVTWASTDTVRPLRPVAVVRLEKEGQTVTAREVEIRRPAAAEAPQEKH